MSGKRGYHGDIPIASQATRKTNILYYREMNYTMSEIRSMSRSDKMGSDRRWSEDKIRLKKPFVPLCVAGLKC